LKKQIGQYRTIQRVPENAEIPTTAVGGWFKSGLQAETTEFFNPTNGSWWIAQVRPSNQGDPSTFKSKFTFIGPSKQTNRLDLNHPPTPVGGIRKSEADFRRLDLNHPPTPVGGIRKSVADFCRLDLNNPPTPVGGIRKSVADICRLDLNHPPTPVGGISESLYPPLRAYECDDETPAASAGVMDMDAD
jgi:hypothetical protein